MTKREKSAYYKWAQSLSPQALEEEYYRMLYSSLGSVAERMYDLGYDMADVLEQEKHERDVSERLQILEVTFICRGIQL